MVLDSARVACVDPCSGRLERIRTLQRSLLLPHFFPLPRVLLMLGLLAVSGCYAGVRGTVKLMEGDQELAQARAAGAQARAVYEWTLADEYMKKARDEWARSEYESAEKLVVKAKRWAAEADRAARNSAPLEDLDSVPEAEMNLPAPEPKSQEADTWDDDDGGW